MAISRQVSPHLLLGVSAGYFQRTLVGESRMIRTWMGKHNRSVMVAMYGTHCAIPPLSSNSLSLIILVRRLYHE
jgi:hypothetical protein